MTTNNEVKLTKLQRLVKWVYDNSPMARGSNTELYIAFLEAALQSNNQEPLPEEVKRLMRKYKPESITRARRAFAESTEGQRLEEINYINQYS